MSEDLLRYDLMIEAALRDVVRETLSTVAENGLPGEHHFYITFATGFPGVKIPDYLHEQYPEEMTIVLQYQFFGLKLDNDILYVTLSFNNIKEQLHVPIDSITTFADPSVNFALQFQSDQGEAGGEGDEDKADSPAAGNDDQGAATKKAEKDKDEKRGEVISLDMFRKK